MINKASILANLSAAIQHDTVSTAAQCTQSSERSGQQEAAKTWGCFGVGVVGCLANRKMLRAHAQVGGCQNYGPFLGTLNNRCRIIIGTQKGTIILTITQVLNLLWPSALRCCLVALELFPLDRDEVRSSISQIGQASRDGA